MEYKFVFLNLMQQFNRISFDCLSISKENFFVPGRLCRNSIHVISKSGTRDLQVIRGIIIREKNHVTSTKGRSLYLQYF